ATPAATPATPARAVVAAPARDVVVAPAPAVAPASAVTPPKTCVTELNAFKISIDTELQNFINSPVIPALLKPVLQTFKDQVTTALSGTEAVAGEAASDVYSIVTNAKAIIKSFQPAIAAASSQADSVFTDLYKFLDDIIQTSAKVISCGNVPKSCKGFVPIIGSAFTLVIDLVQNQVKTLSPIAAVTLNPIIDTAKSAVTAAINGTSGALKLVQTAITLIKGAATLLPATFKLPLDVLEAVVNAAVSCNPSP
ncbi:hypothetical protein BGZ98_009083, partial [Dissophora globulifera]